MFPEHLPCGYPSNKWLRKGRNAKSSSVTRKRINHLGEETHIQVCCHPMPRSCCIELSASLSANKLVPCISKKQRGHHKELPILLLSAPHVYKCLWIHICPFLLSPNLREKMTFLSKVNPGPLNGCPSTIQELAPSITTLPENLQTPSSLLFFSLHINVYLHHKTKQNNGNINDKKKLPS